MLNLNFEMSTWNTRVQNLVLFDVDGTLTPSRRPATDEVKDMLRRLREVAVVGFVGGSDFSKQKEQLGDNSKRLN